jgi:Kef-type K+ transport system membrane component KefB
VLQSIISLEANRAANEGRKNLTVLSTLSTFSTGSEKAHKTDRFSEKPRDTFISALSVDEIPIGPRDAKLREMGTTMTELAARLIENPYAELALILLIASFVGAIGAKIRQPVLISYILVGILVGPTALHLVTAHAQIDLLAQIGVTILLFIVGLKLDLNHIRHIGPVALATGLGQLTFTIAFGFLLIYMMGRSPTEALYIAVALTFSSTIIIVKLLTDKRELDSLHGRIAVGFLIVQDIAVVVAMMTMSALGDSDQSTTLAVTGNLLFRLSAAAVVTYLLMRHFLPRVMSAMASSQELLMIFAIAWGTMLAAVGEWAGFSKEAGAFLAGFSLAGTHYREAMNARLAGIRDFMLLFFFIDLGARINFSELQTEIWPAIVLSLFVLIGNPLIVMAIMGFMGYRRRTGFLAGLTVAQISEFSIVFVAMGITLGHVGTKTLGLTTLVGLVTITLSTYMILYSQRLYQFLSPWLGMFERTRPYREIEAEERPDASQSPEVVVFGVGRYGRRLLSRLVESGIESMGVDFDPEAVRTARRTNLDVRFGDGEDQSFVETLPLSKTRWVVAALPDWESNRALLKSLELAGYQGPIAGVARDDLHEGLLRESGIKRVLNPFTDAADFAADLLKSSQTQ